jgi:hypothetical protein
MVPAAPAKVVFTKDLRDTSAMLMRPSQFRNLPAMDSRLHSERWFRNTDNVLHKFDVVSALCLLDYFNNSNTALLIPMMPTLIVGLGAGASSEALERTAHYHGRYKGVPGEWHLYAVAQNT